MSKEHERIEHCKDPNCIGCVVCNCFVCKHCGLYEGSLTTHCPEKTVTFEQSEAIYKGELNFRGGIWVKECSEHSPAWYRVHSQEWQEQHGVKQ